VRPTRSGRGVRRLLDLRLWWKLLGAIGLVLVFSTAQAIAAYRTSIATRQTTAQVARTLHVMSLAGDAEMAVVSMDSAYRAFLVTGSEDQLQPYATGGSLYQARFGELQAEIVDDPTEVVRWQEVDQRVASWRSQAIEPTIQLRRDVASGRARLGDVAARESTGLSSQQFAAVHAAFADAVSARQRLLAQQSQEADDANAALQRLLIAGALTAIATGLGLAWLLTWHLTRPIALLAQTAGAIADGDLSRRINFRRGDEIGQAAGAFDRMADTLERAIRQNDSILRTAREGIVGFDPSGTITFANPAAGRLTGHPGEELVGQGLCGLLHHGPASASAHAADACPLYASLRDRSPRDGAEDLFWRADGTSFPVEYTSAPVVDDGRVVGAVLTFRGIGERQRAEAERVARLQEQAGRAEAETAQAEAERVAEGQRFLAEVSRQLADSLNVETTLQAVLRLAVPALADCCLIDVVEDDDAIQLAALAHVDPAKEALIRGLRRRSTPQPSALTATRRVMLTGSPLFYPEIPDTGLVAFARDPEHLAVLRSLGLKSVIGVPLLARGRTFGTLVLLSGAAESGRRYGDADLALAEELARRAALALDNARLYESERRAHIETEAERQRIQFLEQASAVLSASLDAEDTLHSIPRLAVPFLADWCAVDVVEEHGAVRRVAVTHVDPSKEALVWRLQRRVLGQQAGSSRILHTEEAELVAGAPGDLSALVARSYMSIPLAARGQTLGAVLLATAESGRRYGPEDLALGEELVRRVSQAVDNARLYAQAQQAVRVRDEFLAATSHELRTPLAHIKGFVSTLRQTDVQWDEAMRQDFLSEIEREADRLARLIGNLLDISRIASGGLERADRAPTPPLSLVSGGLDRMRGLLGKHPVEVDVPADLPLVDVDASRLEQVIANLVDNAAKYAPAGTPIRLAGALVNGAVELRAEDTGPGIPPDDLERIFEKFVRRSSAPGTGLGLAICRGIIQAHRGRIWAENRPSGGACFIVSLPVTASAWEQLP